VLFAYIANDRYRYTIISWLLLYIHLHYTILYYACMHVPWSKGAKGEDASSGAGSIREIVLRSSTVVRLLLLR